MKDEYDRKMKRLCKAAKILLIKTFINFFNALGMKKNLCGIKPMRFLIISTTGIGDTLWGTPAIRALKETYPKCYLGVLTNVTGAELLKGNPYIDRFFIFKRGFRILSLLRLLRELRKERFEVAFIFHASDRIIWPLVFLTGAGEIIGIKGQNKGLDFILTKAVGKKDIHGIEMRLMLIKEAGVSYMPGTVPSLYLTEEERKSAAEFYEKLGFDRSSLIVGLHPGAQKPFKCWPLRNFIETANRLVRELGCKIIITGDSRERGTCEELASKIEGAVSIAGKSSLRETAAAIEQMDLYITNDTGPMHIAFALKTPTIALFCPTDPGLCGPYRAEKTITIKKPITCNPCIGKECLNPVCMEQITVEEVTMAAKSLIPIKQKKNGI
ncbi:MAG: glycosyltransferase family 9 protein [Thermodesulfovibrionales bacterium]